MISEIIDCDNETARSLENIEKLIFGTAWNYEIIQEKIKNKKYEIKKIIGHYQVDDKKECPSFDVPQWLEKNNI